MGCKKSQETIAGPCEGHWRHEDIKSEQGVRVLDLSKGPWADCDQDCFEAYSGYKSGKKINWKKANGESRKVELPHSVADLKICRFTTLSSYWTFM